MSEDKKKATFADDVKTIIYAILLAIVIRTFLYEPFSIPSASMYPNLLVGDYLFVSKYTYGYSKHSFPMSMMPFSGRIWKDEPKRGDIIVFKKPSDNRTDFIKRLVGLPGDRIQVLDGRLYINGSKVDRKKIDDYVYRDVNGNTQRYYQYIETFPEGHEHVVIELNDHQRADNTDEFKVPPGHYFFMGDNRDNSTDSRFPEVGMVPEENLEGKARVIFLSKEDDTSWWELWKLPRAIRWDRIFDKLDKDKVD